MNKQTRNNPEYIQYIDIDEDDQKFLIRLVKLSKGSARYDEACSIRLIPCLRKGECGEYIAFKICSVQDLSER